MPGSYLLDTNAVIALLENDPGIKSSLQDEPEIFIETTVLGELYFGARKSHRVEENTARIDAFAEACPPLSTDLATSRLYGRIKADLRSKGRPIPENDIWIAAMATRYELTLLTRDRHFFEVDGLRVESWPSTAEDREA